MTLSTEQVNDIDDPQSALYHRHSGKKQRVNFVLVSSIVTSSTAATMSQQNEEDDIAVVSCNESNASMSDHETSASSIASDTSSISSSSTFTSSSVVNVSPEQAADRLMNDINEIMSDSFLAACRPLYFPSATAQQLKLSPRLEDGLEQTTTTLSGTKRGRDDQDYSRDQNIPWGGGAALAMGSTIICTTDATCLPPRNTSAVSLDQALIEQQ